MMSSEFTERLCLKTKWWKATEEDIQCLPLVYMHTHTNNNNYFSIMFWDLSFIFSVFSLNMSFEWTILTPWILANHIVRQAFIFPVISASFWFSKLPKCQTEATTCKWSIWVKFTLPLEGFAKYGYVSQRVCIHCKNIFVRFCSLFCLYFHPSLAFSMSSQSTILHHFHFSINNLKSPSLIQARCQCINKFTRSNLYSLSFHPYLWSYAPLVYLVIFN